MNTFTAFVVGLLQAALSLLGFTQVHPEIPQTTRDQAQHVAQQATTQATNALNPASTQATKTLSSAPNIQNEWKTYTNKKFGYSIRYPGGWIVESDMPIMDSVNKIRSSVAIHAPDNSLGISVTVNDKKSMIPYESLSTEKIIIDSVERTAYIFPNGYEFCDTHKDDCSFFIIPIYRDEVWYEIHARGNARVISEQWKDILASFVFVSGADVSESDISVPGMSKYTDSDFGFSFWYPSGWKVTNISQTGRGMFAETIDRAGNFSEGRIFIQGDGVEIDIDKIHSEERTYNVNPGACGYCAPVKYFFDTTLHQWMRQYPEGIGGAPDVPQAQFEQSKLPLPADVSHNTMGGLHMFNPGQRENAVIIPLSARNFLAVRGVTYTAECASGCAVDGGIYRKGDAVLLAETILATDSSVATPVSPSEQVVTIKAEKQAYIGQ